LSDGLVGAVVCDGQYIVTSPNTDVIFVPALGGDHSLFLRTSLRFGDDDPLQWPQPWVPEYPHLACIPVPTETGPLSIMQWMPEYHDFVLDRGILIGIGKVHPIQCYMMRQLCIALSV
jgi:hypothetical protein